MSVHDLVVTETRYSMRGFDMVWEYEVTPPLPEDRFSYRVQLWEMNDSSGGDLQGMKIITADPDWVIEDVVVEVPLDTAVLAYRKAESSHDHLAALRGAKFLKRIQVACSARVLRYGGYASSYRGSLNVQPATSLPLEVLSWKVGECQSGELPFTGHTFRHSTDQWAVVPVPSIYEVARTERWEYPTEPAVSPMPFPRFYFREWLKDRTLEETDVMGAYQVQIRVPYEFKMAEYDSAVVAIQARYCAWLESKGVLLTDIEDVRKYFLAEALPAASEALRERAKKELEEAGHPELFQ